MEIKLKNNKIITIERELRTNVEGGDGVYKAFDEKKKQIGFLRYKYDEKLAYIDNIAVSENFAGFGVGHFLISCFEQDIQQTKAKRIVGVYMPRGLTPSKVKEFYLKHGYEFDRDKKTGDLLVVKKVGRGTKPVKDPTKKIRSLER